jgi:hypothetical protein
MKKILYFLIDVFAILWAAILFLIRFLTWPFTKGWPKFAAFLRRFNEWFSFALAFILWKYANTWLMAYDPAFIPIDASVFQNLIFALAAFFLLSGVAWLYLKIAFPGGYKILDDLFTKYDNDLTLWQKVRIVSLLFCVFLLSLVLLASVL